jgi:hypothetical protein
MQCRYAELAAQVGAPTFCNEPTPMRISQEDLVEVQLLEMEYRKAKLYWQRKLCLIERALRSGAQIEEGIHAAELVDGECRVF